MSNADLKVGDKVQLSKYNSWADGEWNPVGIDGTVFRVEEEWLYVMWGNGTDNSYRVEDSDLITQ